MSPSACECECRCPLRSEENIKSPGARVMIDAQCGCWEPRSGSSLLKISLGTLFLFLLCSALTLDLRYFKISKFESHMRWFSIFLLIRTQWELFF